MKIPISARLVVLLIAWLFLAQPVSAGPVSFVVDRTAHFMHKAASKIDSHVIEPGRRAIVNHTPRPRRVVHRVTS